MKPTLSIATRTFLLTFAAMCVVLLGGFFALNAALKTHIKEGLKDNLRLTERQLDQQQIENNRRSTALIATLSENPSLKAAIGLSREQTTPALRSQVRATIEDQLRQLSQGLDFDLFVVLDTEGTVIATVGPPIDAAEKHQILTGRSGSSELIRAGDDLYQVTSVPINLDAENLGTLAVGERLDLNSLAGYGYAVLREGGKVVASNLPTGTTHSEVESELSEKCGKEQGCEIRADGHDYLVLATERQWASQNYQLLRLASIDDAMRGFTQRLRGVFLITGLGGMLSALFFSLIASRSVARPLVNLASHLETSGETGVLWTEVSVDSSTREVNLLADALNRAATARRQVEHELRAAKDDAEAATSRVEVTYDETLEALGGALDLRDNETAGHSHRVTRYSLELAKRMGCQGEELKHIERGAYLHDIGKIGTPDAILLKPGKLTPEEREVMQQHARIGYELVSRIAFLTEAAEVVYAHQERWDGKGYPRNLAGEAIPLGARIFAVADTFDAMTSNRPYRKALPFETAMEEIRNESGKQFDPKIVQVLNTIPAGVWEGIRRDVAGLGGSVASKRAPLGTMVACKRGESRLTLKSINISESGMLLDCPEAIRIGEELELDFNLPESSQPLKPRVIVIRKEPRGMGVRFITLTLDARESIRHYTGEKVKVALAS